MTIRTTLENGGMLESLERIKRRLAPEGDWTEANRAAAEFDRNALIAGARARYEDFLNRGGLRQFAVGVGNLAESGSPEHRRFIRGYITGFEQVFNRKVPGMFVSGGTGIGKTYNAVMCCKTALWSPDFTREVKTEWAGKVYREVTPATCCYLTSTALVEQIEEAGRRDGGGKTVAVSLVCGYDIVVLDDVGFLSDLGRRNSEVSAVNRILRAKPDGLILQTRLPLAAFRELFGESAADIVARFYKPETDGCVSRR